MKKYWHTIYHKKIKYFGLKQPNVHQKEPFDLLPNSQILTPLW